MLTIANDIDRYRPVIALSRHFSRSSMKWFRFAFLILTLISAMGTLIIFFLLSSWPYYPMMGAMFIFASLWLDQVLIYAYHNSYYYYGLQSIIGSDDSKLVGITYDVAKVAHNNETDLTEAFVTSTMGSVVLLRSGITPEAVNNFLKSPRQKISADMVALNEDKVFTLIDLGEYLLRHDQGFKNFLKELGINEIYYKGSLRWVVGMEMGKKFSERWWGKDNLSKVEGIGREWSFGVAYILQKFSRDIRTSAVFSTLTGNSPFAEELVRQIETILARSKAANLIVIGEAGVGKMDIILEVNRRMHSGKALGAISDKQMIVLDTNRLFATHKEKQELELTIIQLFTEATKAGNVIIVIENLSSFVREAEAMGVLIPEVLDQYLAHPDLHVIATDTPGAYHTHLEPLGAFTRRFAEVLIDTPDLSATTRVLQGIAMDQEVKFQTIFTYQAVHAITECADRYIVDGVLPDKAIELLIEIATRAGSEKATIVNEEFVYNIVTEKTGVPTGPIKEEERDLLLHIEDKLHERVIGQQRALDAIARTMRRARTGIQASDRPIGSFLFLGPTGVGKTETAKALAHIFFKSESNMHRIDMSEFSGVDALQRLIGDGEHSGVLSDMLREHPYSVLLLDEFEKATLPVHDLFLQILDEGVFTDSRGSKVNARNTIIIATSNAGSQLILKTIKQRKELATLNQEIIDHIVREGIYRPELINRFDSTIIFEPLNIEEQGEVASLMLGDLYKRIKDRGYELMVGKDLMDLLVEKGYNPEYGARPMQRVIQDIVEEKVAQKIIMGEAKKGDTIKLSRSDFSEAELNVVTT